MAFPSRESTSRGVTQRQGLGGNAVTRLHIDPALLDAAYEYQFIRETCLGEYDEGNVQAAMEQGGFVPVSSDELPGAAPPALPGRKAADKLIRRGGQILMRRSKEIAQGQGRELREANDEAIRSVTKDLSGRMDGRNFQDLAERPVTTTTERGDGAVAKRFAE